MSHGDATGPGGTAERWFAYGNGIYPWGIDEALIMGTGAEMGYMKFRRMGFSPCGSTVMAPSANATNTRNVRLRRDAYGNCTILSPTYEPRLPRGGDTSDYDNPYLFTGRRLDILDNGSLKLQYNRNRYYDQYTGRWLTHDPLGYVDGLNLYEYVGTNPTVP